MPLTRPNLISAFGRACDLGNGALFVGAGLSMGAGLPSWSELLEEPRTESDVPDGDDLPLLAEYIVAEGRYSRVRLNQHILDKVSAAGLEPTVAFRHLVRLPVDQIWTTNYDPLIESTTRRSGDRVIATDDDVRLIGTSERAIVKMHGSVDSGPPSSWASPPVITRSDYELYETEHPRMWALLRATYLSKTMLFIGFSFSDPNIEVLQRLARLAGTATEDRHMAVLPRPVADGTDKRRLHDLRVRDLEGSGVRVLEIDDFNSLTEILSDLVRRTREPRLFVSGSHPDESTENFDTLCAAVAGELANRPEWELASLGGHAGWGVSRRVGRLRREERAYDPSKIVLHYRRREGQAPPDTLDERASGSQVRQDWHSATSAAVEDTRSSATRSDVSRMPLGSTPMRMPGLSQNRRDVLHRLDERSPTRTSEAVCPCLVVQSWRPHQHTLAVSDCLLDFVSGSAASAAIHDQADVRECRFSRA